MRALSSIAADVDRGAEIVALQGRLKAELTAIGKRLTQDALDRPDEHVDLADAGREGKQFLAEGSAFTLPIILTADKLVQKFAAKSAVHKRIALVAGEDLARFYRPVSGYVITQKNGKQFRAFAAEILGDNAPALIAACRALDKFGIPKSDIKLEWKSADKEDGGDEEEA